MPIKGWLDLPPAMRNQTRAVELYQTALQIAPNNAALWYEMGMSHNYQRNWGPALQCLNRAVQLDPSNRSYSNTLGIVLAETGRYDESLGCFIRANGEAMGYLRLAQTLQHLQQPELSRQYLEVALQKDPNLSTTMVMRSEMKGPSASARSARLLSEHSHGCASPVRRTAEFSRFNAPPTRLPVSRSRRPHYPARRLHPVTTSCDPSGFCQYEGADRRPTAPQPFVVPPPPQVNLHYAEPTPQ